MGHPRTIRAAALCAASVLAVFGPTQVAAHGQPSHRTAVAQKRVGTLELTRCHVLPHAWCGHLKRPWDPTGAVKGDISVGFAFLPASDRHKPVLGTVVPHEGGPGYSTTDSATDYAAMYGPLLKRRNLLVVDQRGTGRSDALYCPTLQDLHGPYDVAAKTCGDSLGDRSDLYDTNLSADDVSAVISALKLGKVDLYGDSYGTFFTQVFAGRHPGQIRSIVLDSAYPPTGETQWYPTQTPAMRQSFNTSCRRSRPCANASGTPMHLLRKVLAHVRKTPYRGIGYTADGHPWHVTVNGAALVGLAFGATYGPEFYREVPAALRSALHGDRAPLIRLVAEADYGGADAGPVKAYSEGLDAAVSCEDYPQLYDMADPPSQREKEYHHSVRKEKRNDPNVYAPFTIKEYLHSIWEEADWCLKWPSPSPAYPAEPPAPPSGHYPDVPTLVLSGELDSITTPTEAGYVTNNFPDARHVIIANSFHVTAEDDSDGCATSILRVFVAHPKRTLTPADLHCANQVPPVRALGRYRPLFTHLSPVHAAGHNAVGALGRRAVAAGAETVADLMDRWYNNYNGHGVGLYGGTWRYSGDKKVRYHLHDVRLERDLAVSGHMTWRRYGHHLHCHLTVERVHRSGAATSGSAADGTLVGHWNTRAAGATAHLHGTIGGHHLHATMLAP